MPGTDKETLIIFTDGGARGNPGPAGIGAVFFDPSGTEVGHISKYIGEATNNVAEYLALIYALQEAIWMGARNLQLKLDSQLVVRQLIGEYKVKDQGMRRLFDLCLNLFRWFDNIDIKHVPRDENKEADKMVNKAIDIGWKR